MTHESIHFYIYFKIYLFERNYQLCILQCLNIKHILIIWNNVWHTRSPPDRYLSPRLILYHFTVQEPFTWIIPNFSSFLQHPMQFHTSMSFLKCSLYLEYLSPLLNVQSTTHFSRSGSNGTAFLKPSTFSQLLSSLCCCSTLHLPLLHSLPHYTLVFGLPICFSTSQWGSVDTFSRFN